MRVRQYAKRTIETYIRWIAEYIRFHKMEHPQNLGDADVEAFLTHLVINKDVAASTQSTALNALSFLYKEVLNSPLSLQLNFNHSHRPRKLPVVLTRDEVGALLNNSSTALHLPISMMFASGLRITECLRLRVQDIDFTI